MSKALVLGGGGPVGVAWETGLIAGLAEHGVRLDRADHIVGTSAGSLVGALLSMGYSAAKLVEPYLADDPVRDTATRPRMISANTEDFLFLAQKMQEAFMGTRPGPEVRMELGAWALKATTVSEQTFIDSLGSYLSQVPEGEWPSGSYACTAVDTDNGDFVVWDRASGVSLARAVASSCAVPGIFPPITIKGRRYMDGGMRSMTNADLARGYPRIVVIAVVAGAVGSPLAQRYLAPLQREVDALRDAGHEVEVITPDAGSLEAFGANLMDYSRRNAAASNGVRQGKEEAKRLSAFWM